MNILDKIKKAGLAGCGGACFSTGQKWEMVKRALGKIKFVIMNASEGEPNVFKDEHILKNWPEETISGIKLAVDFFSLGGKSVKGYIYLNHNYFK